MTAQQLAASRCSTRFGGGGTDQARAQGHDQHPLWMVSRSDTHAYLSKYIFTAQKWMKRNLLPSSDVLSHVEQMRHLQQKEPRVA